MSEYDVLINKYDALNAGYDQLYPKPMKHANTHASGGTDPITPSDIGAYNKNEIDTFLANKVAVYSRADIGDAPNFDNPGVNGLFEMRSSDETPNETGIKPFNGFGALLNLKTPDNIAMLQIAGGGENFFIRARQQRGVTMKDVPWKEIATKTDLDTKVSKSGDTMTGALRVNNGNGELIAWSGGCAIDAHKDGKIARIQSICLGENSGPNYAYFNGDSWTGYDILHTGNAQKFGFPKIAIGSYVGTGTYSSANPNSLNFDFEPKVVIVVADGANSSYPGFVIVRGQSYSNGIGSYSNGAVGYDLRTAWAGNSVSWYTNNTFDHGRAYAQLNAEGVTYRYIALG